MVASTSTECNCEQIKTLTRKTVRLMLNVFFSIRTKWKYPLKILNWYWKVAKQKMSLNYEAKIKLKLTLFLPKACCLHRWWFNALWTIVNFKVIVFKMRMWINSFSFFTSKGILFVTIWKMINLINNIWKLKLDSWRYSVQRMASQLNP